MTMTKAEAVATATSISKTMTHTRTRNDSAVVVEALLDGFRNVSVCARHSGTRNSCMLEKPFSWKSATHLSLTPVNFNRF